MNHKRRRAKHQRAGCLWCKPHKDERRGKGHRDVATMQELKARQAEKYG